MIFIKLESIWKGIVKMIIIIGAVALSFSIMFMFASWWTDKSDVARETAKLSALFLIAAAICFK